MWVKKFLMSERRKLAAVFLQLAPPPLLTAEQKLKKLKLFRGGLVSRLASRFTVTPFFCQTCGKKRTNVEKKKKKRKRKLSLLLAWRDC